MRRDLSLKRRERCVRLDPAPPSMAQAGVRRRMRWCCRCCCTGVRLRGILSNCEQGVLQLLVAPSAGLAPALRCQSNDASIHTDHAVPFCMANGRKCNNHCRCTGLLGLDDLERALKEAIRASFEARSAAYDEEVRLLRHKARAPAGLRSCGRRGS